MQYLRGEGENEEGEKILTLSKNPREGF